MMHFKQSTHGCAWLATCDKCAWLALAPNETHSRLLASCHEIDAHGTTDEILDHHECVAVLDPRDRTWYLAKEAERTGAGWHYQLGDGRLHYATPKLAADALALGLDPIAGEGEV
jgi:hypothetical protein